MKKNIKKILPMLLALLLVTAAMSVLITPIEADAAKAMTVEELKENVIFSYEQAKKLSGRSSFNGYCGTMVGYQLKGLGINTNLWAVDGNKHYDHYINMKETSTGYKITCYSASSGTIEQIINSITKNGTVDAYNLLVGFQKGSTSSAGQTYGHVMFINGIIDGTVYFCESYNATIGGKWYKEGTVISCSISTFANYYKNACTQFEGIVHFGWPCECEKYNSDGTCSNCGQPFNYESTKKDVSGIYAIIDETCPSTEPYEAKRDSSITLKLGTQVELIGKYTNAFGNTWYKVSYDYGRKTGFVYETKIQLVADEIFNANVIVTANKQAKIWSVPCSDETIEDAFVVAYAQNGELLYPTRIALNIKGNYWYEVKTAAGDQGWIFCDNTTFKDIRKEDSSVIIGSNFPSTIVKAGRHVAYEVKTSGSTIKNVTGAIYNGTATSGTAVYKKSAEGINSKYYNINGSAIDNALPFGSLTVGNQYTLVISADLECKYFDGSSEQTYNYTVYKAWTFNVISSNTNTLTIYYNANGGTIDSDSDYYLSSSIVYEKSSSAKLCRSWKYGYLDEHGLHNNTTLGLYRDGYTFLGWSLSTSGGEIIDHDAVVTPESIVPELVNGSKTVTMYAIWEKDVCNHYYDNSCDTSCNDCGEIRSTSHSYDNACDADCNICGEVRAASDHVYSYSCDESCDICGYVRSDLTHEYGELYQFDDKYHIQDCENCSVSRAYTHLFENDCDATCDECGYQRSETHTYDNDCDDKCNVCGKTRIIWHHYTNVNYEYDSQGHWTVCPDCGYTSGVAEHMFGEPIYPDEPTCTEPGWNHKMCAMCGYDESGEIPPKGHSYGDFVISVDATCTENGEETKTCSSCGDTVTQSIPAKGHTYGDFVVTKEASCNSKGTKEKTCSACDDVIVEEIPVTDHEYGDWYTVGSDGHGTLTEKRECEDCGKYEIREVEDPDYDPGVDDEPKGLWEIIADFFEQIIAWIMNLFGASEE